MKLTSGSDTLLATSGGSTIPMHLLGCPACKADLSMARGMLSCLACGTHFQQQSDDYVDLLLDAPSERDENEWEGRLQKMERWYQGLIDDFVWATYCFENDYRPFAPVLAALSGRVLDLGGGNGVARHYLPPGVHYMVLDPSLSWLKDSWSTLAETYPCLASRPSFIRGVGEYLPFKAEVFDVVMAFWSLNHVSRPEQVVREVARVLKQGGRFLAVLEDMEPTWHDFRNRPFRYRGRRHEAAMLAAKLRCVIPGIRWPLQFDHLRLYEADLRAWSERYFNITRRSWTGGYLLYVFEKKEAPLSKA